MIATNILEGNLAVSESEEKKERGRERQRDRPTKEERNRGHTSIHAQMCITAFFKSQNI